ncbi:MAG: prolyl oligopeptidase family serine peptidase [Propionicimonas sp.]|nr:prolyl oligopeptidase family serine peptidase [Propionicimonas sp.]
MSTPFHDLESYIALPRLGSLVLSPDGTRLVVTVQTLNAERTAYSTALWEIDPAGKHPAHRLTRSAKGESSARFTSSGDLLFTSARPDPDGGEGKDEPRAALWLLPAAGGEARVIATAPGGLSSPLVARSADVVSVAASLLPSAADLAQDAELRQARKDLKVSAILHSSYPVRYWDHDLGPDFPRRFVWDLATLTDEPLLPPRPGRAGAAATTTTPAAEPEALQPGDAAGSMPGDATAATPGTEADLAGTASATPANPNVTEPPADGRLKLRQLTGAGRQLIEHSADLSSDGSTLALSWAIGAPGGALRSTLVLIDTATGERRTLVDDPGAEVYCPALSPDGAWVGYLRETLTNPEQAPVTRLALVPTAGGDPVILADDWDRWPNSLAWLPDGCGLVVTADSQGRGPIFLASFADGPGSEVVVEQVTVDDASFGDVRVAPDGATLYALRSSYAAPAEPVRIDLAAFRGSGRPGERTPVPATLLRSPVAAPPLPGELRELDTMAADGTRIRAWLALPAGASRDAPAPLLLWIHGGPLSSWNGWSWRWNPWLMVAQGYAVLMPDPALSTGYGQEMVQRGWGRWGAEPYTDLLAITDAAERLPEIDQTRTAAMGGSFGGYMANWVAGHTDRFSAIVTHASLWALDQFGPTTDAGYYWQREMTPEMAAANSPHRFVGQIRTPMLVVLGDRDYRVPIGEGLRLWFELNAASGLPAAEDGTTVHRFLYFPDENHWVLSPQHARLWYQTVEAFLAEHVLGQQVALPSTLG